MFDLNVTIEALKNLVSGVWGIPKSAIQEAGLDVVEQDSSYPFAVIDASGAQLQRSHPTIRTYSTRIPATVYYIDTPERSVNYLALTRQRLTALAEALASSRLPFGGADTCSIVELDKVEWKVRELERVFAEKSMDLNVGAVHFVIVIEEPWSQ